MHNGHHRPRLILPPSVQPTRPPADEPEPAPVQPAPAPPGALPLLQLHHVAMSQGAIGEASEGDVVIRQPLLELTITIGTNVYRVGCTLRQAAAWVQLGGLATP
jgi:hypothetical protein